MINNYSKIRLILSVLLIIIWIIIGFEFYNLSVNFDMSIKAIGDHIEWFPILLLFIGSILFVSNKLWADIISFFALIFLLIYSIIWFITDFKQCRDDVVGSCINYFLEKHLLLNSAMWFPILIFLVLLYLSFEFYKRKHKVYE